MLQQQWGMGNNEVAPLAPWLGTSQKRLLRPPLVRADAWMKPSCLQLVIRLRILIQ